MRMINYTSQFKQDYKREKKGRHREILDDALMPVVELLAFDSLLEPKYCDHVLSGNWKDFQDCYVKPDLILIYQKPDARTLRLVRLDSHSELGL
ncbi:type II toxin-antitoxin system YafQ family toxin [Photorhabdus sp. CRCIA-P01]|uniref:type II toxin-antitoxin system YafQ family toxin n=1 Tax=Photorhabdus sp. CRCIA-P01 TaxID=2019570 RepID=UPI000E59F9AA|nr:type II toxin-antitoxin system YafQ family toxin [Photorhabdus sp. CRCIA-P01]